MANLHTESRVPKVHIVSLERKQYSPPVWAFQVGRALIGKQR